MDSESDRVIDIAALIASIILNDIRLTVYDCVLYEPLKTTENGDKFIPGYIPIICWIAMVKVTLFQMHSYSTCHNFCKQTQILHFTPTAWIIHVYTLHVCLPWTDWHPEQHELCRWLQRGTTVWTSPYVRRWHHMTWVVLHNLCLIMLTSVGFLLVTSYDLSGFTQFVFDNVDFCRISGCGWGS